ncbi:MAG TPA: hypothetical protein VGH16_12930 [Candidatus Binatia bacterium]
MGLKQPAPLERVDRREIDDVHRAPARRVFGEHTVQQLLRSGAEQLAFDARIFLLEAGEQRVAVVDVERRIPDDLALFFGGGDKARGLSPRRGSETDREYQDRRKAKQLSDFAPHFSPSLRSIKIAALPNRSRALL